MSDTTTTTATSIDRFLASVCGRHEPDCWAPDAVLDAVVPGWRFSATGAAAVDSQFRAWFRDPGTLEELRRQDHMWCGGRWPATLLAQMEAAGNAG